MRHESGLNLGIDGVSVMVVLCVEDFINKTGELCSIHRGAPDANHLIVRWHVATSGEVVERRDEFELGEIAGDADNDEGEVVHRGSLAW